MMNLKEIQEMIKLMNENNLVELELERDGLKVRLRKSTGSDQQPQVYVEKSQAAAQLLQTEKQAATQSLAKPELKTNRVEIKAPMVGTFYRAPSPEAAPFVEIGQVVEVGQVLCIIEAMKLMNEIKSETRGKIIEITVNNGDPIQFGQALFIIETT